MSEVMRKLPFYALCCLILLIASSVYIDSLIAAETSQATPSASVDNTSTEKAQAQAMSASTGLNFLEVIVGTLAVILAVISVLLIFLGFGTKKLYDAAKQALDLANEKIESAEHTMEATIEDYYKDFEELSQDAHLKLNEAEKHLNKLDKTDILIKTKIEAIQKTLILCLNQAPNRDIAFSTYSKLLSAYEVLLHNGDVEYTPEFEEEMEMAAVVIRGNKDYVPPATFEFIVQEQNLPFKINTILY